MSLRIVLPMHHPTRWRGSTTDRTLLLVVLLCLLIGNILKRYVSQKYDLACISQICNALHRQCIDVSRLLSRSAKLVPEHVVSQPVMFAPQ